ncbi:MAG: efflux RND transporter periplasmic adaptor subunit, partial [Pseudomonadota bacterium]
MKISVIILMGLVSLSGCDWLSRANKDHYGEVSCEEIDVASRLPGRIKQILVKPGQRVKKGDPLIEFEDDILVIKKQAALATISAAENQQAISENAVRPEMKTQMQSAASAAKKQMEFAKSSLERTKELLKEGAVAQQTVDEVEMKYKSLVENYTAANAALDMATGGARKEVKATAAALVEQAKARLAEIESFEKDMSLKSPVDADILQVMSHEGELVPMGYPVVTLLKSDQSWVSMNVRENDLKPFTMNRKVEVEIPALENKRFEAQVKYI